MLTLGIEEKKGKRKDERRDHNRKPGI